MVRPSTKTATAAVDEGFALGAPCEIGVGACRRDGVTTCDGNGGTQCDAAPGAPQPESCGNNIDDDCDGLTDEGYPVGELCELGVGICARRGVELCRPDGLGTACNAMAGAPRAELCGNTVDDDCDAQIDEAFVTGSPCGVGVGACAASGAGVCSGDGLSVVCDAEAGTPQFELCGTGQDEDCDGQTDEIALVLGVADPCAVGEGTCEAAGTLQCGADGRSAMCDATAGTPVDEVCGNALDDNCNGATDEGFNVGLPCSAGVGACFVSGQTVCSPDGAAVECDVQPGAPNPESCDGVDNDCDGLTDQGFDVGAPCVVGIGACTRQGVRACTADGSDSTCTVAAGDPNEEICDGLDNDCDGVADEVFDTLGQACSAGMGACGADGLVICADDGAGVVCDAPVGVPGAELCDAIDNDCDGAIDETFAAVGEACADGLGACREVGVVECVADGSAAACTANASVAAAAEECGDQIDNDCDGSTDEGFAAAGDACQLGQGACVASGAVVCTADRLGLVCDAVAGAPSDELCGNDLDDDCDDVVDEGYDARGDACSIGVGACEQPGVFVCRDTGLSLVCNAEGDAPVTERCGNQADDDCDGATDEGFALVGSACTAGEGVCSVDGVQACDLASGVMVCDGNVPAPGLETCGDGLDSDCDGQIDEDFEALGAACTSGIGGCARSGTNRCAASGTAMECDAIAGPAEPVEVCGSGVDDDCDGATDEGFVGLGEACIVGLGACETGGVQSCNDDGTAVVCGGEPLSAAADDCIENGVDDDCNGVVDDCVDVAAPTLVLDIGGLDAPIIVAPGTTLPITVTATDGFGVATVSLFVDGVDQAPLNVGAGDAPPLQLVRFVEGSFPTTGVVEVTAEAVDISDNVATITRHVRVSDPSDVTPPTATLTAPAPGTLLSAPVTVEGSADDANLFAWAVEISAVGDGTWQLLFVGHTPVVDGTFGELLPADYAPGDYEIRLTVEDLNGQMNVATTAVTVAACGDELCDGLDNDCDGSIDEDAAGIGQPCSVGVGACTAQGVAECNAGLLGCTATAGAPQPELCNGVDDDCDATTDESPVDVGTECSAGIGACEDVQPTVCQGGVEVCPALPGLPTPEICDQLDNDCDALVDEFDGSTDCQGNGIADVCDLVFTGDCNRNGIPDDCDTGANGAPQTSLDCNGNATPDDCDLGAFGDVPTSLDCNDNGVPDECGNDGAACAPDDVPPTVELVVGSQVVNAGDQVLVTVNAFDDSGVVVASLLLDGEPVALNPANSAQVLFDAPGFAVLTGIAEDPSDNRAETYSIVQVRDPNDLTSPVLAITRPRVGRVVAGPTNVVGSVQDDNLVSWRLTFGPVGDAEAVEIATGDQTVDDAVLGRLIADGWAVGDYELQLFAEDINGRGRTLNSPFVIQECEPLAEICDGRDNDCDGSADEDFAGLDDACTNGIGSCENAGITVCAADGSGTTCDVDPGAPSAESCDPGEDRDCDGDPLNGFAVGDPCVSGVGACGVPGTLVCNAGMDAAICDAQPGQPGVEICDDVDNDCDGISDEGFPSQVCGVGICQRVLVECGGGDPDPADCFPFLGAQPERCNGEDDDCDGVIDEESRNVGGECDTGIGQCNGIGFTECIDGAPLCNAIAAPPGAELCNGLDDDCDGLADEADICPDVDAPVVTLTVNPTRAAVGQPVQILVSADDDRGVTAIGLTIDGSPVALDGDGRATYLPGQAGQFDVIATADDAANNRGFAQSLLDVGDRSPTAYASADIGRIGRSNGNQTVVTLDASASVGGGQMAFAWRIPEGLVVGGALNAAVVSVTFPGDYDHTWAVTVSNAHGTDTATGAIRINGRPLAAIAAVGSADVGSRVELDGGRSTDPEGDPLQYAWQLVDAPQGSEAVMLDDSAEVGAVDLDVGGLYRFELVVGDGLNDSDPVQRVVVATSADVTAPDVVIAISENPVLTGTPVTITVGAADPGGIASIKAWVDDEPLELDAAGQAPFVPNQAGRYEIRAEATDLAGNLGGATTALSSYGSINDDGAPTVDISTPEGGTLIDGPFELIGTVDDTDLAGYVVETSARSAQVWTTAFRGDGVVIDGVLGTVDPSTLSGGFYDVRVRAFDEHGNEATATTHVEVPPGEAYGHLRRVFLDARVPLAGIPIEVRRIYDSGRKWPGDFGMAWSLDVGAGFYEESNPPAEGWAWNERCVGVFGLPGFIYPTQDHIITIVLGDEGYRFNVDVKFIECGGGHQVASVEIEPLPGTDAILEPLHGSEVWHINGTLYEPGLIHELWDPTLYRLTLPDGRVIVYDTEDGVQRIDTGTHQIIINEDGVIHDSGVSIGFDRDAEGRITRIELPNGAERTYTYDGRGDLRASMDFRGAETFYQYDLAHNLLATIDPRGNVPLTTEYGPTGRIVAFIDANGERIDLQNDPAGRQQVVTDRRGNQTIFSYDADGNVTEVVDALGNQTTFTFDAEGNILTQTDPMGGVLTNTYDADGNRTQQVDANGETWTWTYDADGHVLTAADPEGNTVTNTYDADGNRLSTTDRAGAATAWAYDADGDNTRLTDAMGNVTEMTYTNAGGLKQVVDPAGTVFRISNDGASNATRTRHVRQTIDGPVDVEWNYEYDDEGALLSVMGPTGHLASFVRDEAGQVTGAMNPGGREPAVLLDAFGRIRHQEGPDGRSMQVEHDPEGNATAAVLPGGAQLERTYDALNRLVSTRTAEGGLITQEFDRNGRVVRRTSALGAELEYSYDANGNVTSVTAPGGSVVSYQRDRAGRMTGATDASGAVWSFELDGEGRTTRTTWPDGAESHYAFDGRGRLMEKTDTTGAVWRYDWVVERLGQIVDPAGGITQFGHNTAGQFDRVTDALGRTTSFLFDALGRLEERRLPMGQTERATYDEQSRPLTHTNFAGGVTRYTHDLAGRLSGLQTPDGADYHYDRDAAGLIVRIAGPQGDTVIDRDVRGRVVRRIEPTGDIVSRTYDLDARLTSASHPSGVTTYAYNDRSELVGITDPDANAFDITRDLVGRPVAVDMPDGSTVSQTFDPVGRLTSLVHSNADDSLRTSLTYTHDPGTNLAHRGGRWTDRRLHLRCPRSGGLRTHHRSRLDGRNPTLRLRRCRQRGGVRGRVGH